jgi:hypothetical protein
VRGPSAELLSQLIQECEAAVRPLLEGHAVAFTLQRLTAEARKVLAERVEDPAMRYVVLVGGPRLRVLLPGVDGHMAAVAEPKAADVVAEGLAVVLAVRFDRTLGLPAGVAPYRASTPAGGILTLKPAESFHPLIVVETVVDFERHDRFTCLPSFV